MLNIRKLAIIQYCKIGNILTTNIERFTIKKLLVFAFRSDASAEI